MASARSTPRPRIVARRARAARVRGARQVHRLHEGDGAPRVARPEQALGGTVRPAPAAAAAVRVGGGAGAALLREALPRRGAGAEPRGVGCGGGGVAGRRPSAEPRARVAGARGRPARSPGRAGAARHSRTVGAQVRVQLRARGAAGGGRLAQPQETVSAAAAALPPAPPMRRRGVGRVVSARAPDVHDWVHVCVHMCVRSSARACIRT
jgi:hypothetical protein